MRTFPYGKTFGIPGHFLKTTVRVIPVGAGLAHREAVFEGFARTDAREGNAGHAIHFEGQKQAMPMDRGVFVQRVVDPQNDLVALAPAQQRRGELAVHRHGRSAASVDENLRSADRQVEGLAGQRAQAAEIGGAVRLRPGGQYAVAGAIAGPVVPADLRDIYLRDITIHGCTFQPPEVFRRLIDLVNQGLLCPMIAKTYPLSNITQAQADFVAKTHVGKLVLIPEDPNK